MKTTTRREAMKTALKAGVYTAPVILATSTVQGVAAASPPPGSFITVTPISAPLGTTFLFSITGFPANDRLNVSVLSPRGSLITRTQVPSTAFGSATATFPSGAFSGNGTGRYLVDVSTTLAVSMVEVRTFFFIT